MTKILLVDDSSFIREVMKGILSEAGFTEVIEAGSGQEAINKVEIEKPDLVLLDIIMPDMDGIAVLGEINGKAKVCMVTAVGQEEMITKAKEAGASAYITKPFDNSKVLETIKSIIG